MNEEVSDLHPCLLSKLKLGRIPPGFPPASLSQVDLALSSAQNFVKPEKDRVFVPVKVVEGNGGCWLPSGLSFFAQDGVPGVRFLHLLVLSEMRR